MESVAQIVDQHKEVVHVLLEVNFHLKHAIGVQFTIGVGLDGPTASWDSAKSPHLREFMTDIAAMLRRKLDIAAWVD